MAGLPPQSQLTHLKPQSRIGDIDRQGVSAVRSSSSQSGSFAFGQSQEHKKLLDYQNNLGELPLPGRAGVVLLVLLALGPRCGFSRLKSTSRDFFPPFSAISIGILRLPGYGVVAGWSVLYQLESTSRASVDPTRQPCHFHFLRLGCSQHTPEGRRMQADYHQRSVVSWELRSRTFPHNAASRSRSERAVGSRAVAVGVALVV